MTNIVIKIKLASFVRPIIQRFQEGEINIQEFNRMLYQIMLGLEELEIRLTRYVDVLNRFFGGRQWKQEVLEEVGEKILEIAYENASKGYTGTRALQEAGISWPARIPPVKELYRLRGYGDPEGLTTGQDQLIDSLKVGAPDNIFSVNPDLGKISVGTKQKYAKLLEEGGVKIGGHLGMDKDGRPAKWLLEALDAEGSEDPYRDAAKLLSEMINYQAQYIKARPFLKPALWYVRRGDDLSTIMVNILMYFLHNMIREMPNWSNQDEITVKAEAQELRGTGI